jgi:hypothetical protein
MSRRRDPDDVGSERDRPNDYDPSYEKLHDENRPDADESRSAFWPPSVGTWAPFYGNRETERVDEEDGGWWDEGLIATTLIVGLLLFLFPEPLTSSVGFFLMLAGAVAWLLDLIR